MYQIQHIIFRRNIMIQLPHGHAACLGDHTNGRRMISLFEKYSAGTLHYLLMFPLDQVSISRWGKKHIFVGSLELLILVWRGHIWSYRAGALFRLSNSLLFVKHFLKFLFKGKKASKECRTRCTHSASFRSYIGDVHLHKHRWGRIGDKSDLKRRQACR